MPWATRWTQWVTLMVIATRSFVLTAANAAGAVMATASVTVASDATPPSVVSITPPNNATGVAASTNIVVRFSEPCDGLDDLYDATNNPGGARYVLRDSLGALRGYATSALSEDGGLGARVSFQPS